MSAALTFLLLLPEPPVRPLSGPAADRAVIGLRSVARAVTADDRIVVVGTAPCEVERRFADRGGWTGCPEPRRLILDADLPQALRTAAACADLDRPAISVGLGDVVLQPAIHRLRQGLADEADTLWVTNHLWQVAGTAVDGAMACADAARWPAAGRGDGHQALALQPDPRRLVPFAAGDYGRRIADAARLGFLPAPLLLRPPPRGEALALLRSEPGAIPIDRRLQHLDDAMQLLDPAESTDFLAAAAAWLTALPRRDRRAALGHSGRVGRILAALHRRRRAEALAELSTIFAGTDRAMLEALCAETARLAAAADLALPGPDYLRETYARLRGA